MITNFAHFSPRQYVLTLAFLLVSGAAVAAPPGDGPRWRDGARHGPPGAEQQLARLDEALNLSDEQSAELLALLQSADAERQALHEQILEQYRPQFCDLKNETETAILSVLTTEQAETFAALKAERQDCAAGRGWGPGGPMLDCDE